MLWVKIDFCFEMIVILCLLYLLEDEPGVPFELIVFVLEIIDLILPS